MYMTEEQLQHEREVMEELKNYDTPSITNVVATYPDDENCLSLYHPWLGNWYTDQTCKCMFPELGRLCGYAVTCEYALPDPQYRRGSNVGDVFDAIKASPKPVILVVKQSLPEEIKNRNGLLGGNMMTSFKNAGIVGAISDGPSRDLDEVRALGLQYMLTGVTAGHGEFALRSLNEPVTVCGMQVSPGEIIHMDENGAVKFPRKYLDEVLARVKYLHEKEEGMQKKLAAAQTGAEVDAIFSGNYK